MLASVRSHSPQLSLIEAPHSRNYKVFAQIHRVVLSLLTSVFCVHTPKHKER